MLQAGQGDPATWDSALATQIARDTIAFERRKTEESGGTFTWGDILRGGYDVMPTQAARDITPNAGQADALRLVFDALGKDPVAAQDTLLDSDGGVDHDLLHYLYGGRSAGGNAYTWGDALGGTLEAATSYVGPGGEGTRNYDSADIVQDMVHWYGTHPDRYPITMDQHVVDILSHHIQAVNYAGSGAEGPVSGNHADGLLEYQRIALANLDKGDLANLLKNVFGEDYYAQHGEHADPSKGFPMYQHLSAAQQAAFRRDFLEITGADPFDQGRLEALAHQQGSAQNDMALNLRDALKAQGASADQADADAKAAFDFVLGLGIDQPADGQARRAGRVARWRRDRRHQGRRAERDLPRPRLRGAGEQRGPVGAGVPAPAHPAAVRRPGSRRPGCSTGRTAPTRGRRRTPTRRRSCATGRWSTSPTSTPTAPTGPTSGTTSCTTTRSTGSRR
ncbi:hypothetical protein GCM10025868_35160 [Angustibacter aerolatus]|uniref:Uncharacterized protein n=1 Tax=Angustibacter aerolatus TaxID=1162965 RepID=A0ABQ6JNL9_9ACTN|nr:hypothetical protein [Angustibacter aerolatus]GMA88266.1 hypothetical protein GCM10025868_35160 [Angustibacter aerolatus]